MKNSTLNQTPIAERKFVLYKLSAAEENALRERNANERAEAEKNLRVGKLENVTGEDMDARLDAWLLVNEGRHLRDKKERGAYIAESKTVGAPAISLELPEIETVIETPATGILEDN